jgi:hypothetical protein
MQICNLHMGIVEAPLCNLPFPYTKFMIYGYIRVSTDKQTTENQRFEILKYASEKKLHIKPGLKPCVNATEIKEC